MSVRSKVAFLGTGLIGGSVAAALKRAGTFAEIAAWTPGDDAQVARALGHVDTASASLEDAVSDAAFILLASPVSAMPELFAQMRPFLSAAAVITDCASTKRSVVEAARTHLGEAFLRFVPGHPIAGSERSGPQAANPDLFRGKRWFLCPAEATPRQHCESVRQWLEPTGANFETMDAAAHDRLFAEVSHWPHAVAFALSAGIGGGDLADAAATNSGAGLRDTTRIGASSPALWADILLDNRDACEESAARFRAALDAVENAMRAGDREALVEIFSTASRWRSRMD